MEDQVYELASIAEEQLRTRNSELLINHNKSPRIFSQIELSEWLGVNRKTIVKYVEKMGIETNAEKSGWYVDIEQAYAIRSALKAEGKVRLNHFKRLPGQKMQVVAIANQKGGVGKTISTATIASYFAIEKHEEFRIGLVDCDPQGTLSMFYDPDRAHEDFAERFTFGDLLLGKYELDEGETLGDLVYESFRKTTVPNVRILSASESDRQLEGKLHLHAAGFENPYNRLKNLLDSVEDKFDIIFIDTPPSMTYSVYNSLYAATSLIIPITPAENDRDATLHWLSSLPVIFTTMKKYGMEDYTHDIKFLLTNHDGKYTANIVQAKLNSAFTTNVLGEPMKHNEAISRCAAALCTVFDSSRGQYDGNKKTFNSAVLNCSMVGEQVLKLIVDTWSVQLKHERQLQNADKDVLKLA